MQAKRTSTTNIVFLLVLEVAGVGPTMGRSIQVADAEEVVAVDGASEAEEREQRQVLGDIKSESS